MLYSNQNNEFIKNKYQFFAKLQEKSDSRNTFKIAEDEANRQDYSFILNNHKLLENELNQLVAVLPKESTDLENEFMFNLYAHYCATLLEEFYKDYEQPEKAARYSALKDENKASNKAEERFIAKLQADFTASFSNLVTAPAHVSKIKDYDSYLNMLRLYWIFTRLTFAQAVTVATDMHILDKLDAFFGTHNHAKAIVTALEAPIGIVNYFSVGIFLVRFALNAAMLVKHTFLPNNKAKEASKSERFFYEFNKRKWGFMNDVAWASVNFLCNFREISGLSGPVASYLTFAFLSFDVAMVFYKLHLDKQDYLAKRSQYLREIEYCKTLRPESNDNLRALQTQINLLEKQLKALEMDWKVNEATLYYVATAASLLALGFGLTLVVNSAILPIFLYYTCLIGGAVYMSINSYAAYVSKSLLLEEAPSKDIFIAQNEFEIARDDFVYDLGKKAMVPMLIISVLAFSLPAAIALTAVSVSYEGYHAYSQFHKAGKAKRDAENAPAEEIGSDNPFPAEAPYTYGVWKSHSGI